MITDASLKLIQKHLIRIKFRILRMKEIPNTINPHEITVVRDDPDFYRVQDHGRLTAVHVSKHSCVCVLWWWWCVSAVWCVCVCSVRGGAWRGLARGKPTVCRLQTSPCVGSKRIRVYWQNARMLNTCARFANTHGSVLNVHTELFLTSLSFSRPFSLSLPSFSFSSLSSLSNNDNDYSSSLSVYTRL